MTPPIAPLDIGEWPLVVRDVSGWAVTTYEVRGKRSKQWVRDPDGRIWLKKEALARAPEDGGAVVRPYELAIEVLVLRLAATVGIEVPRATLAEWKRDGETVRGTIIEKFTEREETLLSGNEVLAQHDPTYNATRHEQHTLDRVFAALEALEKREGVGGLCDAFFSQVAFDAWVGNTDRHQGNWGVINSPQRAVRVAPMYDPAACFGSELQDGDGPLGALNDEQRIESYMKKCRSGFGDGRRLITMDEVIGQLTRSTRWLQGFRRLVAKFEHNLRATLPGLIQEIPPGWLTPPRRQLIDILAERRLVRLQEALR